MLAYSHRLISVNTKPTTNNNEQGDIFFPTNIPAFCYLIAFSSIIPVYIPSLQSFIDFDKARENDVLIAIKKRFLFAVQLRSRDFSGARTNGDDISSA